LIGGEAAVREPWRIAVAALVAAGQEQALQERLPMSHLVPVEKLHSIRGLAAGDHPWPLASGAGRLFEAAGALCGLVGDNAYEGEAAIRLEALAAGSSATAEPWPELLEQLEGCGNRLPSAELLACCARRLVAGEDPAVVAAAFHTTFSAAFVHLTERHLHPRIRTVAIGGGCLANRLLRQGLREGLEASGRECLLATAIPPGDGGLSFGQAVLAAVALSRDRTPSQTGTEPCV
jgi:hydrogenase maturation protein HypF